MFGYKNVFIALVLSFSGNLFCQIDGTLDETYGISGKISLQISAADFFIYDAKILEDQSIICTGLIKETSLSSQDIFVAKISSDGKFDTNFNGVGWISIDIDGKNQYAKSLALQMDGKIVVAGYHFNGSNFDMSVVRLNENGSLDNDFDSDGMLTLNFGSTDNVNKVLITQDNKILLAGRIYNGINSDIAIVKLNNNGSFDSDFGVNGVSAIDLSNKNEYVYDALMDGDKIVVGGEGDVDDNSVFLIAKYNSDGSLDMTFGTNGYSIKQVGSKYSSVNSIKKMINGNYILAGGTDINNEDEFSLVSFNKSGELNIDFSEDGILTFNPKTGNEYLKNLIIQEDGKIIAAGNVAGNGSISDFGIMRLQADGNIDDTFGNNGIMVTDFAQGNDNLAMVAITENKKIMALGNSALNNGHNIVIAKYHNSALSGIVTQNHTQIKVSPNPFNSEIMLTKLENGKMDVFLYNMNGILVKKVAYPNEKDDSSIIMDQLEHLESGIYYLKIKTDKGLLVQKIAKV